jgi:hypothetical protein
MSSILLTGNSKTPEVKFELEPLSMAISGRSIPENSIEFYQPLLSWVDQNLTSPDLSIDISFRLEYFNTSSSKCIMD